MSGVGSGAHGPTEPHPLEDHSDRMVDEERLRRHRGLGEGAGRPPRALSDEGVAEVKRATSAVHSALRNVEQHFDEGVSGVGLEDALNTLQERAYLARSEYAKQKARGPRAATAGTPAGGSTNREES